MMMRELKQGLVEGQLPATKIFLDAQATLDGAQMNHIPKEQRYMSARRAILRRAQDDGAVKLEKVGTADNLADIFTKPLVGEQFERLRAHVLGL